MFTSDPHSTSASHHVLNALCICLSICSCCVRLGVRAVTLSEGNLCAVSVRVCILCESPPPPCAAMLVRLSSRCPQVRSLPVSLVFEKQSNCTEVTATVCIYVPVPIPVLQWLCLFCLTIVLFMLFGYLHAMTRSHEVFDACLVAHNMRF